MKKTYIIIAVAIVVLAAGGVAIAVLQGKNTSTTPSSNKEGFTAYDACRFLTKEKAAELLGTSATLGQEPSPSNSDDLKVTNCVYNNNAGNFKDIVSVSMLVRSPLTKTGAESNAETFADASIVGDAAVNGYGEKAMWNTTTGQLNILKDKSWIIITFGKVQANTRTLDDAKKAADLLLK